MTKPERDKLYYQKNRVKILEKVKEYYYNTIEKQKEYDAKNRDKHLAYNKVYGKTHRKEISAKEKLRKLTDPQFKLSKTIRIRILRALKKGYKTGSSISLLGCSISDLKVHLEKQFKPGMTWDNHSTNGWHIDHKLPCVSFDLTKEAEQKKCFHYTNLQPLWACENYSKGDSSRPNL